MGVTSSGETALSIADREDWRPLIQNIIDRDWLGHVAAGYMLRWIVSRWKEPETRADASLGRAAGVVEEWCKQHRISGGGLQNLTRNIWPRYKSVSHLWAAFSIAQDAEIDIKTPTGLSLFFGTAEWLLSEASSI